MKVAYIIGPLHASSVHNRIKNIRKAEEFSIALWSAGFAVICPHLNSGLLQGASDEQNFIDGYLELLKRCNFAVALDGWTNSKGSLHEIEYCRKNKISIYTPKISDIIKNEGRQ